MIVDVDMKMRWNTAQRLVACAVAAVQLQNQE
jgi:hypothetical protein